MNKEFRKQVIRGAGVDDIYQEIKEAVFLSMSKLQDPNLPEEEKLYWNGAYRFASVTMESFKKRWGLK